MVPNRECDECGPLNMPPYVPPTNNRIKFPFTVSFVVFI